MNQKILIIGGSYFVGRVFTLLDLRNMFVTEEIRKHFVRFQWNRIMMR